MTLFTAECMVNAQERDYIAHIRKAYLDLFATQTETMHSIDGSALAENAGPFLASPLSGIILA